MNIKLLKSNSLLIIGINVMNDLYHSGKIILGIQSHGDYIPVAMAKYIKNYTMFFEQYMLLVTGVFSTEKHISWYGISDSLHSNWTMRAKNYCCYNGIIVTQTCIYGITVIDKNSYLNKLLSSLFNEDVPEIRYRDQILLLSENITEIISANAINKVKKELKTYNIETIYVSHNLLNKMFTVKLPSPTLTMSDIQSLTSHYGNNNTSVHNSRRTEQNQEEAILQS